MHAFGVELRTWALVTIATFLACALFILWRVRERRGAVAAFLAVAFPLCALGTWLLDAGMTWLGTGRFALGEGQSDFGALFVIVPLAALGARFVGRTPGALLDLLAPAFPLAAILGRVACTLNGCCYGRAAEASWLPLTTLHGASRIDFPLLYSLLAIPVVAIAELARRKRWPVFAVMIVAASLTRFPLEFVRADAPGWRLALNAGQLTCVALVVFAAGWLALLRPERPAMEARMNRLRLVLVATGCATLVAATYVVLIACASTAPKQGVPPEAGPSAAAPPAEPARVRKDPVVRRDLRVAPAAKMVVVPIKPVGNVSAHTCELLTSMLLTQLDEVAGLKTVSRDDIEAMLGVEKQKDLLGCSTTACAAEIGGAMGADFVLRGEVGQLGSSYNLNFSAIRSKGAAVAARTSTRVDQTEDAIADALPGLVADIVDKLNRTQ